MYPSMNTTELGNSTKNKFADFSDTEDFHGGEATAAGGGGPPPPPPNKKRRKTY